jgi:isopentenyl diphosphate isomerase/L-lactate dehydrogenase-like FMN-dependent dehydrogenase
MSSVSVVATPASTWTRAAQPINLADYESHARTHLPKQVYDYYKSGAHDEITLAENVNSYNRIVLRPRALCDVKNIDCQRTRQHSLCCMPFGLFKFAPLR